MCSLRRLPVAKNHNFRQIVTFLGAPVPTPFTNESQIRCPIADHGVRLPAKFRLDRFTLSSCGCGKHQFLPFFGLRHLVLSPIGSVMRKLNTSTQLQTFPYPTVSKSFLYSHAFVAKSGTQSLTFKSVTKRQTDKQKTQRFWLPRRRVKSEPHQTWHGDRGPRASSCTFKTFGV